MKLINIAIIGTGNMGSALLKGLLKNGYPPQQLWVTDPDEKKLKILNEALHIHTTLHNEEAIQHAEIVILAVKPQIMQMVSKSLAGIIQQKKPLVLSIAAGIRIQHLENWLGKIAIVRGMPNTPALIAKGITALVANDLVTTEEQNMAMAILNAVGKTIWLENENQMDTVTALSGSGPAYFFIMMEALQNAAQKLGLPSDMARLLTMETAVGSTQMAGESPLPVNELRNQVTSKGGTTEAAISILEKEIFKLFETAIRAANERSKELGAQFGKEDKNE